MALGRYFLKVYDHTQVMEEIHHEAQGAIIRDLSTKKVSMRMIVSPSLDAVVIRIATIHICRIKGRINLVVPFKQCSRLFTEVSLVLVIVLVSVVVIL